MSSSQSNLLAQARSGDVEAFATVFEGLRPKVFAIAMRIVGADDAGDVTMETYIKAWKALPRFRGTSALSTWLYRIAHNCAMDCLRDRNRWCGVADDFDENTLSEDRAAGHGQVETPADKIGRCETKERVTTALSRLDQRLRTTLLLRYADDLSYKEIAAATGANIGTVMSRIFNGKKKMKQILLTIPE